MSYYILPKITNVVNVNPSSSHTENKPYISQSLLNFYNKTEKHINDLLFKQIDLSINTFNDVIKIINPYEFIFTKVPGTKFSVSKLRPQTNLFYDLLEIFSNLNIINNLKLDNINILHVSPNHIDSCECIGIFREEYNDKNIVYNNNISIEDINSLSEYKLDFIFYETNTENYLYSIIQSLLIILKYQSYNGIAIIKIDKTFDKSLVDILYFLSSLYDKVYICKPSTSNITTFERYIICKNFIYDENSIKYLKLNYIKLVVFLKKMDNNYITDILDINIPYYFKNKIDDLNIIIGQQQLEALDQIISICTNKNKNKEEKMECIKKTNIQKSISWCEKHKIPCNKFSEKINIFLPIVDEIT